MPDPAVKSRLAFIYIGCQTRPTVRNAVFHCLSSGEWRCTDNVADKQRYRDKELFLFTREPIKTDATSKGRSTSAPRPPALKLVPDTHWPN
jgi:hypothetical protein